MHVEDFIESVLAQNAAIQQATGGRMFAFTTEQGTHTYPFIWWQTITSEPIAKDLKTVGEAWRDEVQVDVFAGSVSAASKLADTVRQAFNNATLPDGILSSEADQITPSYCDEDESIHYAVRVFVNHKIEI